MRYRIGIAVILFLDMDGVLADFDQHHEDVFGYRSDKLADNVDWEKIRATPNFYADIPPMADLHDLWAYVVGYNPIVLTGIPYSVPEAADNKRAWVRKHLGPTVSVICTQSSRKCEFASKGDILVDDWEKYRHRWEAVGGRWITHTSAANTIKALQDLDL